MSPPVPSSDYPDSYVLAGCEDEAHCGTFVKTETTCDCAPTYQKAGPSGEVLYRGVEDTITSYDSDGDAVEGSQSRWYVGSAASLETCGITACQPNSDSACPAWHHGTHLASGSNAEAEDPLAPGYFDAGGWVESNGPTATDCKCIAVGAYSSCSALPSNWVQNYGFECIPTELNGYCSDGGKVNIGDEGVLATVACCECGSGSTNNPVAHGAITVVPSNSGRAESCELHGTWDADDETCACSGNYIGELCFTECPCGGHGEQLDIAAAREADSCDAGSCSCEQGYFGEVCSSAGR